MRIFFSIQQASIEGCLVNDFELAGYECFWNAPLMDEEGAIPTAHDLVVADNEAPLHYFLSPLFAGGERPYMIQIVQPEDAPQINQYLEAGVTDIIFSPVTPAVLMARVNAVARKDEKDPSETPPSLNTVSTDVSHLERLSTLGTLTASLMHELNNHLCYIQGTADLLVRCTKKLGEGDATQMPKVEKHMDRLKTGVGHMAEIIRSVQSYARSGSASEENGPGSLMEVIDNAGALLSWSHRGAPTIHWDAEATAFLVAIDPQALTQVILNVMINASHAMTDVEDKNIFIAATPIENNFIELTLRDSGPGIPQDILSDIWDPFFTTKADIGNGLGLFICRRIVEGAGGSMSIENHAEGGAVVTVLLPKFIPSQERIDAIKKATDSQEFHFS